MTILVWDIETVPDERLTAAHGGQRADFPKLIHHSIVCIGALLAERTDKGWTALACDSDDVSRQSEADLIESFVQLVDQCRPRMVTFNGHSFDLPVLRYRAMVHKIGAGALADRPYFHRFTGDNHDLCDVFSSFGFGGRATLDEIAKAMDLPGKPEGMDGSQVEPYFRAGRIDEIAEYCRNDVVTTYRLWLRHELFCGRLTEQEFCWSEAQLADL